MIAELEQLGFTKEEILERVVTQIVDQTMSTYSDEDGGYVRPTKFASKVKEHTVKQIDKTIDDLAKKFVHPGIAETIESLCLQKTNEWGEKKGEKFSFVEYLVSRAEHYLTEQVDYQGKSYEENRRHGSSWTAAQTRIVWMINQHLQYSIETAMKQALKDANSAIVGGIEAAIKIKLEEVAKQFSVAVKTR